MPVLVVLAENEIIIDTSKALARTRRLLPTARTEVLADCGHMVTFDQSAAALLREVLRPPSRAE
jgi:pimeloyl-ACP methyl ester carboxylesterase